MRVSPLQTLRANPRLRVVRASRQNRGWAEQDWYEAETNLRASKQTSVVDTNVQQERYNRETHAA